MFLYDDLARRGRVINTLIQPRVEAFEWFVGIEDLPELPNILRQVCRQYPCVVRVEVSEDGQRGGSGVASEIVIQGGEVCVFKYIEEPISEGSVDVTTFVILSTLFSVLTEESLLLKQGCPCQDVCCATGVSRAYEWVLGDEGILGRCQDETKVAVLGPVAGTINRRRVCGDENMGVSDGAVDRFPRLIE